MGMDDKKVAEKKPDKLKTQTLNFTLIHTLSLTYTHTQNTLTNMLQTKLVKI